MRTNIVLDDQLIQEALKYAGVRTKREVVALALEEFVANRRRRDLRALAARCRRRCRDPRTS